MPNSLALSDRPSPARRRWRYWVAGGAGLLAIGTATLWNQRREIADDLIRKELEAKGIPASYRVTQIGPRTQRLENIVIGDPSAPDLTVRTIEVDLDFDWFTPSIREVRIDGARLRADARTGKISIGHLDKLFAEGGDEAFALPSIAARISDTRARVVTEFGTIGVAVAGSGNLNSGFDGQVGFGTRQLSFARCEFNDVSAPFSVRTARGAISLNGPINLSDVSCPALANLDRGTVIAALQVSPALDQWSGTARMSGETLHVSSINVKTPTLRGEVQFSGNAASTQVRFDAIGIDLATPQLVSKSARFSGSASVNQQGLDTLVSDVSISDLRRIDTQSGLAAVAQGAGTAFDPLISRLDGAIRDAEAGNQVNARLSWDGTNALLSDCAASSDSGARLLLNRDGQLTWNTNTDRLEGQGALTLSGGGLPDVAVRVRQRADGRIVGTAAIERYAAKNAALALSEGRFEIAPGGEITLAGTVMVDGSFPTGRVRGLEIPGAVRIAPNGQVALLNRCLPVQWNRLDVADVTLQKQRVTLCRESRSAGMAANGALYGTFVSRNLSLKGQAGASPFDAAIQAARFDLARGIGSVSLVKGTVGSPETALRFTAERIYALQNGDTWTGRLDGATTSLSAVPLDLSSIRGDWRLDAGQLVLTASARIEDRQLDARFNPLVANNARLTFIDGQIDVTADLSNAKRSATVGKLNLQHQLGSGQGDATIVADDGSGALRFGNALQPDDLTSTALGVIANAQGEVRGSGLIRWDETNVESTGTFSVNSMDFAAAFGPVQGFSTTIEFIDLLNLRTAPDQRISIAGINAGIEVTDGKISYALTGNQTAQINWGRWPFAGGTLELLPTTLDFSAERPRNMAFRLVGMDAGALINTMQLENLSATGTYDGLIPMVFDENGGRIVGGLVVARQSGLPPLILDRTDGLTITCDPTRRGGNLSYVGEVSNAQLGTFGRMAFDALKNLRYRCLTVVLDGALDGEIVSQIAFNGINQGTPESRRSFLTRPFVGLPFIFNIKVEAPFRGLVGTYRSFTDPSLLIRNALGNGYETIIENTLAVQPPDSDKSVPKEQQ